MNFETFQGGTPDTSPEPTEPESLENKRHFIPERIKKALKVGIVAGPLVMGAELGREIFEHQREYDAYSSEALSNPREKDRYEEAIAFIETQTGEEGLKGVRNGDRAAFFEREKANKEPTVEGFEAIGLGREFRALLTEGEYYPHGWINGEIDHISYQASEESVGSFYGEKFKNTKSAGRSGPHGITLFQLINHETVTKKETLFALAYTLGHEIGHHNDWELDRHMSLVERAELLKKVIERMESKDAYNSFLRRAMGKAPYHTEIVPNEELSIESARYIQAKEYWAELCMDYFLAPEAMRMDSPEDFELIDGYVKRHDPLFDAAKAADLRDVTINGE